MERISEHMKNSIKKNIASYGVVILFFAAFFLYGLMVVKDYGISTDELIERESSLITYKYIMPSVSDVVTETVNFPELTPLKEYKDRYYGMAVQIPAVVVEHLFGFQQMPHVGAAIMPAGRTLTVFGNGAIVEFIPLIPQIQFSSIGIHMTMASIARRQHTVKKVNAPGNAF